VFCHNHIFHKATVLEQLFAVNQEKRTILEKSSLSIILKEEFGN